MLKTDITLQTWINALTKSVELLIDKRFENVKDMYGQIHEIIEPILKESGFIVRSTLFICNEYNDSFLEIRVESKDDKRVKRDRKGKYIKIAFIPAIKIENTDITLEQYFHQKDVMKRETWVSNLENKLVKAKNEVAELEKQLYDTKAELVELKHKYD